MSFGWPIFVSYAEKCSCIDYRTHRIYSRFECFWLDFERQKLSATFSVKVCFYRDCHLGPSITKKKQMKRQKSDASLSSIPLVFPWLRMWTGWRLRPSLSPSLSSILLFSLISGFKLRASAWYIKDISLSIWFSLALTRTEIVCWCWCWYFC